MSAGDRDHLPALDGVRGIAIGLVMLKHMWHGPYVPVFSEVAAAGAYGVDVFFALSGFLITGILLRSTGKPHYYRNFYVRRFLRIIPLYWAYLTLLFLPRLIVTALGPRELIEFGPAWTYYLFVSNLWFAHHGSFVDGRLDITWSLCIEEQFYLLFPFIVAALPRRILTLGLLSVVVLSGPMRYLTYDAGNAIATYVLTPLRCDGLAMGALVAIAHYERSPALGVWSKRLVLPLTLVIASLWAAGFIGPTRGPLALQHLLVSAWSAAMIGLSLALPAAHPLLRALSNRPLVYVGQVSYALYLLHPIAFMVFEVLERVLHLPAPAESLLWAMMQTTLSSLLSVGIATLTWRTLEAPLLTLKERLAPSNVSAVQ